MRSTAFRRSAPIALVLCVSAFISIEAPADEKRPPRRQAAEQLVGGAKKRVAEVLNAASNKPAAEAPTSAKTPPAPAAPAAPAATATPAKEDSNATVKGDSAKGAAKAEPAKPHKDRAGRATAERDSSEKKPAAEKEERNDEPVRGPRLPVWPGITMANPSAGNIGMLAAAY